MALATPGGRGLGYRLREGRVPLRTLQVEHDTGVVLPASVDLRHMFLPAFDQGSYGTCTCNGAASQMEYELLRQHVGVPYHRSRSFPYYWSGFMEGNTGDTGRDPVDVFRAVNVYGDCPEKDWPYYPTVLIGEKPTSAALKAAERRRFLQWYSVPKDVTAVKQALAYGYSVGIALEVWSSFEAPETLRTGIIPLPGPDEELLGGHYMVLGGYADAALPGVPAGHFVVLNSWGLGVGVRGWMFLPYAFITGTAPRGDVLTYELIALELVSP